LEARVGHGRRGRRRGGGGGREGGEAAGAQCDREGEDGPAASTVNAANAVGELGMSAVPGRMTRHCDSWIGDGGYVCTSLRLVLRSGLLELIPPHLHWERSQSSAADF